MYDRAIRGTRKKWAVAVSALAAVALGAGPGVAQVEGDVRQPDQVAPVVATGTYQHDTDAPVATAVRTPVPLNIDGRLDEEVWMTAPPITDFRQTLPNEGEPVTQRTEVRFLYDDDNIYVGAWLWDTGQILTRQARRDAGVPDADFFVVLFDSYHDHRTAYRFATSPSAQKRDEYVSGDGGGGGGRGSFGDTSWDPIWDVQTSITDEGWFVEFRIPFSQLRYRDEEVQVWGLQVERKIRRHGEETVWAFTPRNERGGVARYGHLVGIQGIAQGKRLELLPYVGGRAEFREVPRAANAAFDNPFRSGNDLFGNAGVDLKYRLTSNLTLDGTINPDFGQVELDPAVINLSAFETRFDEKRPFFVEGSEIFSFGEGGGGTQLLYSRRIGRPPTGGAPSSAAYADVPEASTILGAVKLTGKPTGGWSVGLLNAVTSREYATFVDIEGERDEVLVEPLANYFAGRLRRDLADGSAAYGIIGTAVNRQLNDESLASRLRSSAYALGIDGRIDLLNRTWSLSGALAQSYIRGSESAIQAVQRSSARYFQRPDADHLDYDPAATSLTGLFGVVRLSKNAGDWRGNASLSATTPGYEVNDLGFQSAADRVNFSSNISYDDTTPGLLRSWGFGISPSGVWNFAGEPQQLQISVQADAQLLSFHGFNVRAARQFETYDDRFTRGGPNAKSPAGYTAGVGFNSDGRKPFQVRTSFNFGADDAGGWQRSVNLGITMRFSGIYDIQLTPEYRRSRTAAQFVTTVADPLAEDTYGVRYIFAPLEQTQVSLQARVNMAFTQNLTFELYAQPLLSSGDYQELMEFTRPGAYEFRTYGTGGSTITKIDDGRYEIDPDGDGPAQVFRVRDQDFNVRSLLGNAVLRWEWRPGSTLFLVWQQTRSDRLTGNLAEGGPVGSFRFGDDARAMLDLKPDNIFLIKVNYWLNP